MGGVVWSSPELVGKSPSCDISDLVKATNKFGFSALDTLGKTEENFLFSPLSAYLALAMCPSLYTGSTRSEIMKVISGKADEEDSEFGKRLREFLECEEDNCLSMYCRVIANMLVKFDDGLFDVLEKDVGAPVVKVVFPQPGGKMINDAVEKATRGMIKNLLDGPNVPDTQTMMVLVNAVYFEGKWKDKFDELPGGLNWNNLCGGNSRVQALTLKNLYIPYLCTDELQGVMIPYQDCRAMVILLPHQSVGFDKSKFSLDFFSANLPQSSRKVDVVIPKWSVKTEAMNVMPTCKSVGVETMFTDDAKCSGSGHYYVSAFVQKASIIVDEEGTKAAASSAVMRKSKSLLSFGPPKFIANRPFFYAIYNRKLQVIEFMGYLVHLESNQ